MRRSRRPSRAVPSRAPHATMPRRRGTRRARRVARSAGRGRASRREYSNGPRVPRATMRRTRRTDEGRMPLHAATVFLSAFLLFLVQPILAKQILPWFGGAAVVWTLCMVFFQLVLLLGYAYAHWLTGRARAAWIHVALLAASLAFLPVIPDAAWKPA